MNKLQRLKEDIKSLPAKKSRLNLIGVLQKYNEQTSETLEMLRQTRSGAEQVAAVFPNLDLRVTVIDKINSATRIAQSLRKTLEKIEKIQTQDDAFRSLDETAKAVKRNLHNKWNVTLEDKIQTYDKLVNASSNANLQGSSQLVEKLNRLRGQTNVLPKTEEVALKIKNDLENINSSIQTLGLSGKVGEFLIAAAAGRADAKAVLDAEVRKFIEENNLWAALSVKLG